MNGKDQDVTANPSAATPSVRDQSLAVLEAMEGTSTDVPAPEASKDSKATPEGNPPEGTKPEEVDPLEAVSNPSEESKKAKEEALIPRSRLNEEITKRKALESEKSKLEKKLEELGKKNSELTPEERKEQESLRKIGVPTKADKIEEQLNETNEQLDELSKTIESIENEAKTKEQEGMRLRISELEKKLDGSNGLPKFDIKELVEFAEKENYFPDDPYKLYSLKYQAEIVASKMKRSPSSGTEKGSGESTQNTLPKRATWANVKDRGLEVLDGMK